MVTALLIVLLPGTAASAGPGRWSVSVHGALTTASKLFPNSNARDEFTRGTFSPIDAVFGVGADARGDFPGTGLRLGIGAEYITASVSSTVPNTATPIPVEDGYTAIPVELTGYFTIPVGGDRLDFYMGGGAGIYFGERKYSYAGVGAVTLDRSAIPGIHVLSGLEYLADGPFSVRAEVKFRSIQLETVQKFPVSAAVYGGTTVPLPQDAFTSRIQIDGMHVTLGVAFRIP
jgi:hypothetical protein